MHRHSPVPSPLPTGTTSGDAWANPAAESSFDANCRIVASDQRSGHVCLSQRATAGQRVALTDTDSEIREKAVFDLSQAHGFDGYASIHRIARQDKAGHVREQALFWMAQMGDARARADIVAAIESETSDSVREQAVFALSQLKEGEADNALIALVRGNYPRKVKEQALFWLGQSGSTQALDFLDEVLTRHAGKTTKS